MIPDEPDLIVRVPVRLPVTSRQLRHLKATLMNGYEQVRMYFREDVKVRQLIFECRGEKQ